MLPLALARRVAKFLSGPISLGLVITMFTLLVLQNQPFVQNAELSAYDFQFQTRGALPTPSDIVVVGVDPTSFSDLAPDNLVVQRKWFGSAVQWLCKAGAQAIGFDFLYPNPSV